MIFGLLPVLRDGRAHRGKVDQEGNPREVLEHDPRDDKGDLLGARRPAFHVASARTACSDTRLPSQFLRSDSRTRRIDTGSLETSRPAPARAGSEWNRFAVPFAWNDFEGFKRIGGLAHRTGCPVISQGPP